MIQMNMILRLISSILFIHQLFAQDALIQNVYNRQAFSMNGKWRYLVDPYENGFYNYRYIPFDSMPNPHQSGGYFVNDIPTNKSELVEYNFDTCDLINVPGDWNSQTEKLYYYEGSVWYKKSFTYKKRKADNRLFIYFGAANYQADVYLNAHKLGVHKGGFTPFNYEITRLLNPDHNFLIVKVDNKRKINEVPTVNTDWWNFGGLTREVKIIEVPETFISDYMIQLAPGSLDRVSGYVQLNGTQSADCRLKISIPELGIFQVFRTDTSGRAQISFTVKNMQHWSPQNPALYKMILSAGEDRISDNIGFRSISTRETEILLNGKPIFLKGISLHEENPVRGGRAYSKEDAMLLLQWVKELGCNYVRLAHYPHNEHMVRLADEMGILVWEEIPVYWTIQWENRSTFMTAKQQLTELISRDKNRASVIIWSLANETPVTSSRMHFLKKLRKFTLSKDNTRLLSAALEMHGEGKEGFIRKINDPFAEYVDILSVNEYIGWYDGLPSKCRKIQWVIEQQKPVIISEFGGGALQGYHADSLTRWSEEFQEYLYQETLKMLVQIPQLSGMSPWILCDFHSPRRMLPQIQDGWNRKGLIGNNGKKKKAFYVLKKFYNQIINHKLSAE